MIRVHHRLQGLLLGTLLTVPGHGAPAPCQLQTAEFRAMHEDEVIVHREGKREVRITARIADETSELAAGYQHICPQTIENSTILFLFAHPVRSAFHMYNVHAPLDIAFIAVDGSINEILRMEPYRATSREPHIYRPRQAFVAALEARAGFFADNAIRVGDRFMSLPASTGLRSR